MYMLSVNGNVLPGCINYRVQRSDLDNNSHRDELFRMHRNVVRYGAYKIIAKFRATRKQLAEITSLISGSSFMLTFLDITTNTVQTKQVYAGDREAETLNDGDEDSMLVELSVNFIEL